MRVSLDTNPLHTSRAGVARVVRGILGGMEQGGSPGVEVVPVAWAVDNFGFEQPARAARTFYREGVWRFTSGPRLIQASGAKVHHSPNGWFIPPPRGVKHLGTINDIALVRHPERYRPWHRWSGRRRLFQAHRFDLVSTISEFTRQEVVELLGLDPARVVTALCGCDFATPATTPAPEAVADAPSEFFLFVGSLEPGKNLALLRTVWLRARGAGKPLPPLVVVGARWAGVAAEGAPPEGWIFLGHIPDSKLVWLYQRALGLLFPSKYEGFGLPLAEAMALGCPALCSRVASLPEVGGEAVLYAPLEAEAWSVGVHRLAEEASLRAGLTALGLARAPLFTWKNYAAQMGALYRRLA